MNILQKFMASGLIIALMCLYSCQSCLECELKYTDEQTNKDTIIVRTQCSNKKDREEFESDTKDRALEKMGTYNCIIKEI